MVSTCNSIPISQTETRRKDAREMDMRSDVQHKDDKYIAAGAAADSSLELDHSKRFFDSNEEKMSHYSSKFYTIWKRFSDFRKSMYLKLHEVQSSLARAASEQEELKTLNVQGETEILQLKIMVGTLNHAISEKDALLCDMREIARRFKLSFMEYGLDKLPQYEKLNQCLSQLSDAVSEKVNKVRRMMDEREGYPKLNSLAQTNLQKEGKRRTDLEEELDDAKEHIRHLSMEHILLKEDYELQIKRGREKENQIQELKEKLVQKSRTEAEKVRLFVEQAVSEVEKVAQMQLCNAAKRLEAAEIALATQTKRLCCKHEEVIMRNLNHGHDEKATQADENQKLVPTSDERPLKAPLRGISRSECDLRNISINPSSCKCPDKASSVAPAMVFTTQTDLINLREELKKAREHAHQIELSQRLVLAQLVWLASDRKAGALVPLDEPYKLTKTSARYNPNSGRITGTVNCSMGMTHVRTKPRLCENTCLHEEAQNTAHSIDQSNIIAQINELLNEKDEKIRRAKEKEFLLKQQIWTLRNTKASEEVTPPNEVGTQKSKPKCLSDRLRGAELRLAKALAEVEKWQKYCDEKDSELTAERTHTQDLQTTQKTDMLVRNKFLRTVCQILSSSLQTFDARTRVTSDVSAPARTDASPSRNHHPEMCERKSLCPSGDFSEDSPINSNVNCSREASTVKIRGTNPIFRRRRLLVEPNPWKTFDRPASEENYTKTRNLDAYQGLHSPKTTSTPKSQTADVSRTAPCCEKALQINADNYQADSFTDWEQLTLETTKLLTNWIGKIQPAMVNYTSQQRTPFLDCNHLTCPGEASNSSQVQDVSDWALKTGEQAELLDAMPVENSANIHHQTTHPESQSRPEDPKKALKTSEANHLRDRRPQRSTSQFPQQKQLHLHNSPLQKLASNAKVEGQSYRDLKTLGYETGKDKVHRLPLRQQPVPYKRSSKRLDCLDSSKLVSNNQVVQTANEFCRTTKILPAGDKLRSRRSRPEEVCTSHFGTPPSRTSSSHSSAPTMSPTPPESADCFTDSGQACLSSGFLSQSPKLGSTSRAETEPSTTVMDDGPSCCCCHRCVHFCQTQENADSG